MRLIGVTFDTPYGPGFQVLREIARGLIAHIFLVSDGQQVKVAKVFPPEYSKRAAREWRFGQQLQHPHINAAEAEVQINGYPAVLMPYIPGHSLHYWLDDNSFGWDTFLTCFAELLAALSYLHSRAIVHRDLKPANIVLDRQQRSYLIDFDLAVTSERQRRQRHFTGTLAYLSPEQARGERVSPASDLYAAGIILYRGLSGEVPFVGSVSEVLRAHCYNQPRRLSSFDSRLAAFDSYCASLLAKQPQQRFHSAQEALEALLPLQQSIVTH